MRPSDSNTVTDLSHLGLLQVTGTGAKQLLQGQLTCDLDEISATQSRLGAHCNPQGRILSLFRLFLYLGDYYLQMPAEVLPHAMAALQKYAVFFKVNLLDASQAVQRVLFSGSQLADITLPLEVDEVLITHQVLIVKLPSDMPLYEIMGEATAIQALGLSPTTRDAVNQWKSINISAGIPTVYACTIGKFLPHEIQLHEVHGVSFTKGCYTGQEIIARMQYRGQLKKHLYRATINTDKLPLPGDEIYLEGPCGSIVDSCWEKEKTCQVLVIANDNDVATEQLFLDPAKRVPLECITLSSGYAHV